ncbi:Proteasome assembly chaperone 1 [Symbiodinium microadriaticum]|uniref:Proteasome assembly chaperone 1 n=1 Tax=Symbiodinium microadriaticum TaxID=2951 RepID=A0A1Q9D8R0_SYMMI|nr:Proteasome assembly chaperone 1 [Symbiodinium microadriaticum]
MAGGADFLTEQCALQSAGEQAKRSVGSFVPAALPSSVAMIHGLLDQIQACVSDDDDEQPDVSFVFSGEHELTCQTLVVCGPGPGSAFALQVFDLLPLPVRLEPMEDSPVRALPPPRAPRFFKASDGVVVAVLDTHVSGEYAVAWADTLLSTLKGRPQVLFLDRILRAEWCSCDRRRPEEPYLAGLWTSAFNGSESVPALPPPNFVEGLAAALLSGCEARSWPCLVALALQDGAHMSEGCLLAYEALVPLLIELQVISSWQRPRYREALQKVIPPTSMSIYA